VKEVCTFVSLTIFAINVNNSVIATATTEMESLDLENKKENSFVKAAFKNVDNKSLLPESSTVDH